MTLLDTLKSVNAYPIPQGFIEASAVSCGLDISQEATGATMSSAAYKLTKAKVLKWLADAPNISQGGQSYNFAEEQRERFRAEAAELAEEAGETLNKPIYGYKGDKL